MFRAVAHPMPEAPPKISTFLFREFCIPAQLSSSRRSAIV
jgi:hypothetical protein